MLNTCRRLEYTNYVCFAHQSTDVHAYVKSEIWNHLPNKIGVGNIYEVSTFYVRPAFGRFRPTRSTVSVVFCMQTTVSRSSEAFCDIPKYKFVFAQMDEISQLAEEYNSEQTFAIGEEIVP